MTLSNFNEFTAAATDTAAVAPGFNARRPAHLEADSQSLLLRKGAIIIILSPLLLLESVVIAFIAVVMAS